MNLIFLNYHVTTQKNQNKWLNSNRNSKLKIDKKNSQNIITLLTSGASHE